MKSSDSGGESDREGESLSDSQPDMTSLLNNPYQLDDLSSHLPFLLTLKYF